jgi:hypothetical protein
MVLALTACNLLTTASIDQGTTMKSSFITGNSLKTWATALLLTASAGMAQAQIALTNPGGSSGGSTFLNNFAGGATSTSSTTWTGWLGLSANGGSTFTAYCIDPKTTVGFPSGSIYTSGSLSSFFADAAGYQGQMTSGGYTAAMASGGYGYQSNKAVVQSRIENLYKYAYADSLSSANKAAAFGYALWDIMGSSTSVGLSRTGSGLASAGSTSASADGDTIESRIDALFSALNTGTAAAWAGIGLGTATNYVYTVYYDPAPHASQNFMTVTTVSEPATLALVGLALAGGAFVSRRKRQAK